MVVNTSPPRMAPLRWALVALGTSLGFAHVAMGFMATPRLRAPGSMLPLSLRPVAQVRCLLHSYPSPPSLILILMMIIPLPSLYSPPAEGLFIEY